MSTADPSAGQPRNQGKYDFRTNAEPDVALAQIDEAPAPRNLAELADSNPIEGLNSEDTRALIGLTYARNSARAMLEQGKQYLDAGHEMPAATSAIAYSSMDRLLRGLAAAEDQEARRAAVRSARQNLDSLGRMLEMANGRPLASFEQARGVFAELDPLYEDVA